MSSVYIECSLNWTIYTCHIELTTLSIFEFAQMSLKLLKFLLQILYIPLKCCFHYIKNQAKISLGIFPMASYFPSISVQFFIKKQFLHVGENHIFNSLCRSLHAKIAAVSISYIPSILTFFNLALKFSISFLKLYCPWILCFQYENTKCCCKHGWCVVG